MLDRCEEKVICKKVAKVSLDQIRGKSISLGVSYGYESMMEKSYVGSNAFSNSTISRNADSVQPRSHSLVTRSDPLSLFGGCGLILNQAAIIECALIK